MTRSTLSRSILAAVLAGTALASAAFAHDNGEKKRGLELFAPSRELAAQPAASAEDRPQLYAGIGALKMPVTTASDEARAYFNQGFVFAWGFNHAEARRAFQEAQRLDPNFAMAYWGEALVLGPNINDAMHDDAILPAYAAIKRAMALKTSVSAKEAALIEALSKRYGANSMVNRTALDHGWADAMKSVAENYPDDANVLSLHAEALMDLQPWDYWEADGRTPKKNAATIVASLEKALAADPDHPGAQHLYIHAVEASADPARAEPVADRLRGAVPAVGHLLHMPSHIYMRVGRHGDGIAANRDAIAADEALIAKAGDATSPLFRYGYYPHDVHFLMVSAQMAGVRDAVFSTAEKLDRITSDEVSQQLAWVQAIKTATYSAHAQFADAETILALKRPDKQFPFVEGFWRYARGVGLAMKGDLDGARAEAKEIEALIATADLQPLEAQYVPARDVLTIAKLVVEARIAQAAKDFATAETQLRKAAAIEATLAYTEPPHWYYPVEQTLGAVLLQQGRAAEAAEVFKASLKRRPRNAWALWGLMRAQEATGDAGLADTKAAFERAWLGDKAMLTLDRL